MYFWRLVEGLEAGGPSWVGEGRQNLFTFSLGPQGMFSTGFMESSLGRASNSGQAAAAAGITAECRRLLPKFWKLPSGVFLRLVSCWVPRAFCVPSVPSWALGGVTLGPDPESWPG